MKKRFINYLFFIFQVLNDLMDEETIQISGSDEQVKLDLPQERPPQVKERPSFLEAPRTGRRHRAMRGRSLSFWYSISK